ncbi:hypothetical protein N7495_003848 [Penicillium taxi]|uniref:uncharacterized protein n=1 Tax=Penicillium taxi TaxID=168475 RepID=UPI00254569A5|nr:uncharacterized protein N7495_003848 [Penicillium taxi]KAJ5899104.1 hypothetical protein N7495_003848 [Penicillium taxi]
MESLSELVCLIVDKHCLKKFAEIQYDARDCAPVVVLRKHWDINEFRDAHRPEWADGEIHKEIDECEDPEDVFIPDEKDLIFFEEVEGSRAPILGWMYAEIGYMADLYNGLLAHPIKAEAWY